MAFKCPECTTFFKQKKNLNQHLKTRHGLKPFKCTECRNTYNNRRDLNRHMQSKHDGVIFKCKNCDYTSDRLDYVKRHDRSKHGEKNIHCEQCDFVTDRGHILKRHIDTKHTLKHCNECDFTTYVAAQLKKHRLSSHEPDIYEEESAFDKALYKKTWKIRGFKDPLSVLASYKPKIKNTIADYLEKKGPMKWYIGLVVKLIKMDKDGDIIDDASPGFSGTTNTTLNLWNFEDSYDKSVQKIMNNYIEFNANGSGWILERVENLSINIARYQATTTPSDDSDDESDIEDY